MKVTCWDSPCSLGSASCCLQCEAYQCYPEACDQLEECDTARELLKEE